MVNGALVHPIADTGLPQSSTNIHLCTYHSVAPCVMYRVFECSCIVVWCCVVGKVCSKSVVVLYCGVMLLCCSVVLMTVVVSMVAY